MASEHVRALARVLWDFHNVKQELPSSTDLILVTGSHDDRVAVYGAQVAQKVPAQSVVCSGGYGKITSETNAEPEARHFKAIMVDHGVPEDSILVEDTASNTGENVTRTRDLLASRAVRVKAAVIVTKPYMKRRALATASKQWSEVMWLAAAPEIEFEDYPTEEVPERRMIELMVGDLQRLEIYAVKGFQIPQEIPSDVWSAYDELVALGYDSQVIRGDLS